MTPGRDELSWAPAWQIRQWIQSGACSPVEVTEHFLTRIAALDPKLHAYRNLDVTGARAQARQAEAAQLRGDPLGILHGVPVSIKEHIAIAGLPYFAPVPGPTVTTATRDSIVVERLRAAGAIIFGSTVMPGTGGTPILGTGADGAPVFTDLSDHPRNPWDLSRVPGTSTAGGAASVAAGMTPITIGSDGAGSSRLPAAFSGVLGFHPSFGRVPQLDYDNPMRIDQGTVGPLARDARDIATVMQAIAGPDGRDLFAIGAEAPDYLTGLDDGVSALKLGWTDDFGFGSLYAVDETPKVIAAVRDAAMRFAHIGAKVEVIAEQWEDYFPAFRATTAAYGSPLAIAAFQATMTSESFAEGLATQKRNWDRFQRLFATYDLLMSPTVSFTAPTVEAWDATWKNSANHRHGNFVPTYAANTHMFNIFGWPALSVPCGFVNGRPVAIQIIGKPDREPMILRAAAAFLKAFVWDKRPPI
jgi:aspartyl-tRNA(Asn)/glutamyl-tRNA(Gln) amidotransferase subunit A